MCLSLSPSPALTQTLLLRHFFLSPPVILSFFYPTPSFRFMLVSIPVFQYLHLKFHEAKAVRLSSLGCLSVFSSSPHRFSQSLAARLFLFLSLCTSLSASSSHSPHLSLSAVLHLSINRPKCLVSSDGFSFKNACSFPLFHFLHLHVLLSLMVCLSPLLLCSRLIAPDSLSSRVTCLHLISVRVRCFRGFSLLRLPLTCTGGMMIHYFLSEFWITFLITRFTTPLQ